MRPDLPQFVVDPEANGQIRIFHSNNWIGERQTGAHWGGDLPSGVGHQALETVKGILTADDWDFTPEATKILMLTHRVLANEQGYPSLPSVFQYAESFTAKEHPYIEYFVDELEPACDAYADRKFGVMFEALGTRFPNIRKHNDKNAWADAMDTLMTLRDQATVGEVIDHLGKVQRPRLPETIWKRERELREFDRSGEETLPNALLEIEKLRAIQYSEIKALRAYHSGFSPFETKHGVKGAEFENVLVVVGRGWNRYNFGEMLELAAMLQVPAKKQDAFERNRNLFYVACSRPKRRLSLLFTQSLSQTALATLEQWFGKQNIMPLSF